MTKIGQLHNARATAGRRLMPTPEYRQVMGNPSQMKLWRDERRDIGPKPVRINGRRYWLADEVYAYLDQLAADRPEASELASDGAAEGENSGKADDEESWLAERLSDP